MGLIAPYLPIRLLQSILNNNRGRRALLWLVTQGGQSVSGYETRVSVDQGAMWGAARVIAEEHPDLWGGLVDLDPSASPIAGVALLVRHILSRDGEDQIALRGERRFVLRLGSGHGEGRPKAFQWRPDSTYLITGGFGDIGLLVARAMAAQGARRLVFMGRTPLPPRAEWNAIAPESEIGRRIAGVRGLEALGVAVQIAAVDVSDETQLSAFLDGYRSEGWPPIRGVIHTRRCQKRPSGDHGSSHLRCANARQAASGTIARSVAARPRSFRAVFIDSRISCPFGRRQLRRSQRGS